MRAAPGTIRSNRPSGGGPARQPRPAGAVSDVRYPAEAPAGYPRSVLVCLLALAGLGLFTVNPLLTAGAFLAAAVLVVLLWRPGAPPVLLLVAGMLWLQAATKVLHADALGLDVAALALQPRTIDAAVVLSLLATLAIALGMRIGMGSRIATAAQIEADARQLSIGALATLTVAAWVLVGLAETYAPAAARQLVTAAATLRWAFLFALACTVLLQRRGYAILGLIVAAQLLVGFTGFFSNFRYVLFLLFIAVLTARPHITPGRLPRLAAGLALIIGFGLVWTAIKSDLRDFLNAGTGEQVVLRTPTERLQGLANELGGLEGGELAQASEALVERLAYVDFFAVVLERVPLMLPHEDGALLGAAIRHILMPRVLFPNKPETGTDSDMTNHYTGLGVATGGTSVSLGWPAEAYIDFGRELMFAPILAIGILCGLVYRILARPERTGIVLAYGFAVAALVALPEAGTLLKLIGSLAANFLVLFTFKKVALPLLAGVLRPGAAAP